jgi:hypothetical protein
MFRLNVQLHDRFERQVERFGDRLVTDLAV